MKKKTIKFYFFNLLLKNNKVNNVYFFSKRVLRHRKKALKYKKNFFFTTRRKLYEFLAIAKHLKILTKQKIKLNQFTKNKNTLKTIFLKSFFSSFRFFKNSKKYKRRLFLRLKLWFLLKNKFVKFVKRYSRNYAKTGMLTSNITHFLSRKNISYQIWSKYRSKLFNMSFYNNWFYSCAKYINIYISSLVYILYSFSSNTSTKSLYYDNDFNIICNPRININLYNKLSPYKNILNYNYPLVVGPVVTSFSNLELILLWNNSEFIEENMFGSEKIKNDASKKNLELKLNIKLDFIFSRFFVFTKNHHLGDKFFFQLFFFINLYILLYK